MWLGASLVAIKQPFYINSGVNRTIRRSLFIVETSNRIYVIYIFFRTILLIIRQFFYRVILEDKLHSFNVQDDRRTRFPSTTNYKNDNNIKRFYKKNSLLDGTVQSGQSAIM